MRHHHDDGSRDHRRDSDSEDADATLEDYENDDDEQRRSLEREAGLTAFGGPAFGQIFSAPPEEETFDADHNP